MLRIKVDVLYMHSMSKLPEWLVSSIFASVHVFLDLYTTLLMSISLKRFSVIALRPSTSFCTFPLNKHINSSAGKKLYHTANKLNLSALATLWSQYIYKLHKLSKECFYNWPDSLTSSLSFFQARSILFLFL